MAIIKFKKLNEDAVIPFKKYDSDFCYDLTATSVEEISPGVYCYGTGLSISIDRKNIVSNRLLNWIINKIGIKISLDIRPRSSIFKTGLDLANGTGTIDEHYRGELKLIFYQVLLGREVYKVGDKIAQCKLGFTLPISWNQVDELDDTERGSGGFGHTGR